MATKKLAAQAVESVFGFASDKDAGYNQAAGFENHEKTIGSVAHYVMAKYPKYPQEENEILEQNLAEGYLLKLAETDRGSPKQYGYVGGNYINVTQLADKPKVMDVLTIAFAMGLSNYEYRVLDNPDKKKVVAEIRDMAKTYISQRKTALIKKIEEIRNPEKKQGKRADNKTVEQHCIAWFDTTEKKVKLGQKQGDPHGDPVKYQQAKDAFWQVMFGKAAPVSKK
jgi:hypothetical protein